MSPPPPARSTSPAARYYEWTIALLLTAAAIALHFRYFLCAGPLWRDEVNNVNIAALPTFRDFLANLHNESVPALWLIVLRLWQKYPLAQYSLAHSDRALRLLAMLAPLLTLPALWRTARKFAAPTPVLSLALLTCTSSVFLYGDSIRAFGLGIFLGILMIASVYSFTQNPRPPQFILTLLISLLALHTLYYNCVLLFAAAAGSAAILLPAKKIKPLLALLSIAFLAALSLLIYLPVVHQIRASHMFLHPWDSHRLLARLLDALRFSPEGNTPPGRSEIAWALALLFALSAFPITLRRSARSPAAIYCTVTLLVGLIAYFVFLRTLSYVMQPWYFLPALAMTAICLDAIAAPFSSPRSRACFTTAALALALYSAQPLFQNVSSRRTSLDLYASLLQSRARPGDIIILNPWTDAVTFNRYYHGPVPFITLPPINFTDFQKYDLLIPFIQSDRWMPALIARLADALQHNHHIYLLDEFWTPADFDLPLEPRPQPNPTTGWNPDAHQWTWDRHLRFQLRQLSRNLYIIPLHPPQPISIYESPYLTEYSTNTTDNPQ